MQRMVEGVSLMALPGRTQLASGRGADNVGSSVLAGSEVIGLCFDASESRCDYSWVKG